MIRYALKCSDGHEFESWFASAEAFDALEGAGHLSCAVCGGGSVEKALMAPQVRPGRAKSDAPVPAKPRPDLRAPASDVEKAIAELRRKVETTSEYVGLNFVAEARRMHEGDAPERSIYGEARIDEAKKLLEDGVPVAPLPFRPQKQTN